MINDNLTFHHVGCLVDNIDLAFESYKLLIPGITLSPKYIIESQKVIVAFINITPNSYIELVESTDETTSLNKLKKKGVSFYHLGFLEKDFDNKLTFLQENSYKLISIFNSVAFNNNRCAFLLSPEMQLIELIDNK